MRMDMTGTDSEKLMAEFAAQRAEPDAELETLGLGNMDDFDETATPKSSACHVRRMMMHGLACLRR